MRGMTKTNAANISNMICVDDISQARNEQAQKLVKIT